MKVPLFLGFGDILMLKIKSQKPQLWGFGDQRGMTQITWEQVRGGHFGPMFFGPKPIDPQSPKVQLFET